MTARWTWPVAITGLLIGNVIAMAALAIAAHHGGAQVIPDYYATAAHFDDEIARAAQSQALGWRVDVAIAGGVIDATVVDAAGAPIPAATVRITGYPRARASEVVDAVLTADRPGHYRGTLPGRRGVYDLVVLVDARGAHYAGHRVVEAR